jgi:UDP-N-acetylmuramoyl-L-alanyl-D-glutamate--2,6-diaminopimelate ligase
MIAVLTMKLSTLLNRFCRVPKQLDAEITGLALDSRKVKAGDLFFACLGTQLDGRSYIHDAVKKGARAILAEPGSRVETTVPLFHLKNVTQKISEIAAHFYGSPSRSLQMIGATGTNGKTSCMHFVASALQQLNKSCGVIGTLGNGLYGNIVPGTLTTPDAVSLQQILSDLLQQGAQTVAMEVSSHSIDQGRINGIDFDVGIFTNLTRDHLDYHLTMEAYAAAKKKLFTDYILKNAVINLDDDFGNEIIHSLSGRNNVFGYSIKRKQASVPIIYADEIYLSASGIQATVHTPWGEGKLTSSLIGQFNLSNLLAVLATLCLIDIPLETALNCISHLNSIAGRMQTLGGNTKPLVVVDYAHTPDALEKVLRTLRQHCEGNLYCVFGCGGDRDRGKRPIMANIAEHFADQVIVTDDNPRTENPERIVAEIMQGFINPDKVIVQHDRSKAIRDVIQYAAAGDCILIAGKGAEMVQQIGTSKIPFNDVAEVKEALNARLVE